MLTLFGEPERGLSLATETDVEGIETKGFHISYLRRHQSTKVCDEFCLHTSRKGQFLPHSFGAGLQGRGRRLAPVELSVVDEQAAETRATTRDILRARHHLDIHAEIDGMEGGKRYDGGIGNQGDSSLMGDVGKRLGAELIFPENGDVGNAIGAICSKMVNSITAVITPCDDGGFKVAVPMKDPRYLRKLDEAMGVAKDLLREELLESLRKEGAENIQIMFKTRTYSMTEDGLWTENDLDHADVIGRASGDPPLL